MRTATRAAAAGLAAPRVRRRTSRTRRRVPNVPSTPDAQDVETRDGSLESLECQLAHWFALDEVLDGAEQALGDEDLATLGLAAQSGSQIGDGPDGAVVAAPLEPDGAEGGVALRDPHPEAEIPAPLAPACGQLGHAVAHAESHAQGALRRVGNRERVVEEDHHAVAREALEGPLVLEDQVAHGLVVFAQHGNDLLGLGGL